MKISAALIALAVSIAGPAYAGERFPELPLDQMAPDQRAVADTILSGPRGSLVGPFNAWLRSPKLAGDLQQVGKYIRFGNSLPPRLSELAILINARHWSAQFAWYAHYDMAMKAGLPPAIADAVAAGQRPAGMKADEEAVYDVVTELYRLHSVTDGTYKTALDRLGEKGMVDLIGTIGYYDIVSMTLNVAQVPVPAGSPPERRLAPLPHGAEESTAQLSQQQ